MEFPTTELSKAVWVERVWGRDQESSSGPVGVEMPPRRSSGDAESELGLWSLSRGVRSGPEPLAARDVKPQPDGQRGLCLRAGGEGGSARRLRRSSQWGRRRTGRTALCGSSKRRLNISHWSQHVRSLPPLFCRSGRSHSVPHNGPQRDLFPGTNSLPNVENGLCRCDVKDLEMGR